MEKSLQSLADGIPNVPLAELESDELGRTLCSNQEVVPLHHQTVRGRELRSQARQERGREQAITRTRQATRVAGLRAGLSSADADDLASHFVLSFLRRTPDVKKRDVPPSHLLPLFLRCEISRSRARTRREPTCLNVDTDCLDHLCIAPDAQPQKRVEQRALWDAVDVATWKLPYLQRVVLVDFVLNNASLASIASRYGISEDVAKQTVRRARGALWLVLSDWHEK